MAHSTHSPAYRCFIYRFTGFFGATKFRLGWGHGCVSLVSQEAIMQKTRGQRLRVFLP